MRCVSLAADDMGLGKTLTMISLVLKQREARKGAGETGEKEKKKKEDWLVRKSEFLLMCSVKMHTSVVHFLCFYTSETDLNCYLF